MELPAPKRRLPLRLWDLLHEPRAITLLMMLLYVTVFCIGCVALYYPPSSIEKELGWVTMLWATSLILGGFLGVASTPRGVWWVERLAIIATGTGVVIYLSTVLQLHLSEGGNRLPQAGFILIALISLAIRWVRIRYASLDPTSSATGRPPWWRSPRSN